MKCMYMAACGDPIEEREDRETSVMKDGTIIEEYDVPGIPGLRVAQQLAAHPADDGSRVVKYNGEECLQLTRVDVLVGENIETYRTPVGLVARVYDEEKPSDEPLVKWIIVSCDDVGRAQDRYDRAHEVMSAAKAVWLAYQDKYEVENYNYEKK